MKAHSPPPSGVKDDFEPFLSMRGHGYRYIVACGLARGAPREGREVWAAGLRGLVVPLGGAECTMDVPFGGVGWHAIS